MCSSDLVAASLLLSAWLWAAALPAVDLVYGRGRFNFGDSQATAVYFAIFAVSLALWTAQALYARAFYAARNTLAPMIAGTVITAASIPIFWAMYHGWSVLGLAIASDIGIFAQTAALAILLHRRGLVPLGNMRWGELAKALVTAAFAGVAAMFASRAVAVNGSRTADFTSLAVTTVVWGGAVALGLWITRSELPTALRRRAGSMPAVPARELPQP